MTTSRQLYRRFAQADSAGVGFWCLFFCVFATDYYSTIDILLRQITTLIKVLKAFFFGLQIL